MPSHYPPVGQNHTQKLAFGSRPAKPRQVTHATRLSHEYSSRGLLWPTHNLGRVWPTHNLGRVWPTHNLGRAAPPSECRARA
jgi:hypothetical protein